MKAQSGWCAMEKFVSEKTEHLANLCLTVKYYPFKVNIWSGISKWSATPVLIFTGIVKKEFHIRETLEKVLLPYTQSMFQDGDYWFQKDNNPKHTSQFITLSFLPCDTAAVS